MQKAESQNVHAQNQSAVRQGKGMALDSPQAEQIAQLEAMVESSPQAGKQAQLATIVDSSPAMAAQRKLIGQVHNSPAQAAQRQAIHGIAQRAETPAKPSAPIQFSGREGDEWGQGPGQGESAPPTPRPGQGGQDRPPPPEGESLIQDGYSPRAGEECDETAQLVKAGESSQLKVAQCADARVKPNNTGLPDNLKSGIESLSGMAMDSVKVHYNSSQPAQLNALAYAQGTDIHVAPGQEQHLPHEAWHVVQQAQGRVKPTMQMKDGVPVNDDVGLEREADVMGQKALLQGKDAHVAQRKLGDFSAITNTPMQFVITRSMQKIIDETVFTSNEDMQATYKWLLTKHSEENALVIVNGILDRQKNSELSSAFQELTGFVSEEGNETDEEEKNCVDHGDLGEHDDPDEIDQYVTKAGITQLARKGNTVSGPKTYSTSGGAQFVGVSYTTDGKGSIDFGAPSAKTSWSPPVMSGSEIDLSAAKQNINTKDRAQHFAIGDLLYAKKSGQSKASYTTKLRKSKWTWHHMPTAYKMVLVDMTVHAKHGHNGGVYLW